MRYALVAATLLLSGAAYADEKQAPMCSADGARLEAAAKDTFLVTLDGVKSEFRDAGGVGTGIAARTYADDKNRAFGLYYPGSDPDVPKDGIMLVSDGKEILMRRCPSP